GLIIARLWSLFGTQEHKVLLVGLDNAGKTTVLYQLVLGEAVHTSPTIGSNVEQLRWRNIHFVMWDLGGQTSIRATWETYYQSTDFIILVIDSSDRQRLAVIKDELYKMLASDHLKRARLLVLANKQDINGRLSAAEISQALDLTSIRANPWHIQACCALSGEGLTAGLEWLAAQAKG
ncbi:hypothetical protein BOX15_Mlig002685g2, partial [Macrostomum lignano]